MLDPPKSPFLLPSRSPSSQAPCAHFAPEFPFPVAQVSLLFHLLPPPLLWTISLHGTLYFMQNYTGLSGWATSADPGPLSWEKSLFCCFLFWLLSGFSFCEVPLPAPTAFDMPGTCCTMNSFPSPQFPRFTYSLREPLPLWLSSACSRSSQSLQEPNKFPALLQGSCIFDFD